MTRKEAQIRNHNIMRLHGMYGTAKNIMIPFLAKEVMDAINAQLAEMGAETIEDKRSNERRKLGIIR